MSGKKNPYIENSRTVEQAAQEVIESPSLHVFKKRVDRYLIGIVKKEIGLDHACQFREHRLCLELCFQYLHAANVNAAGREPEVQAVLSLE